LFTFNTRHEEMPKRSLSACLAELIRYISWLLHVFLKDKSRLSPLEVSFASHCLAVAFCWYLPLDFNLSLNSGPLTVHCNTPYRSPVSEPNPSEEEEAPDVVHAPPDLRAGETLPPSEVSGVSWEGSLSEST